MKTLRWLSVAIALLAMLGSGGWLFYQIKASGTLQAENAQLKSTIQIMEAASEASRQAYAADLEQARQDKADKLSLETRVRSLQNYVNRLENTSCLTDDDVAELRRLWGDIPSPGNPAR